MQVLSVALGLRVEYKAEHKRESLHATAGEDHDQFFRRRNCHKDHVKQCLLIVAEKDGSLVWGKLLPMVLQEGGLVKSSIVWLIEC